jgi:hypothetical protein
MDFRDHERENPEAPPPIVNGNRFMRSMLSADDGSVERPFGDDSPTD